MKIFKIRIFIFLSHSRNLKIWENFDNFKSFKKSKNMFYLDVQTILVSMNFAENLKVIIRFQI